jgi:hypothetical protein
MILSLPPKYAVDFSRHPALAMSYTEEYEAKTNKNCVLKI